ncbi:hypothetical protein HYV50_05635 [Candidatus Pacearchaeota archaeon]|nr:hypothetical protein [Candidatus Pacearchaeota archaeon]
MGDKYIKKENGKEIVYEQEFLSDRKIGEVRETLSGDKNVVDDWGSTVGKVERENFYGESRAEIEGESGTISTNNPTEYYKGLSGKPVFKADKKRECESSYSSSGSSSESSGGSAGGGLVVLLLALVGIGTCIENISNKPKIEYGKAPITRQIQENDYQRYIGNISFNSDSPNIRKTIISFDNYDINNTGGGWVGHSGLELNYNIPTITGEFELVIKIPDNLRMGTEEREEHGKIEKYWAGKPLEKIISKGDDTLSSVELAKFYDDIQSELSSYLNEKGYLDQNRGILLSHKKELLVENDQLGRELSERYLRKHSLNTTGKDHSYISVREESSSRTERKNISYVNLDPNRRVFRTTPSMDLFANGTVQIASENTRKAFSNAMKKGFGEHSLQYEGGINTDLSYQARTREEGLFAIVSTIPYGMEREFFKKADSNHDRNISISERESFEKKVKRNLEKRLVKEGFFEESTSQIDFDLDRDFVKIDFFMQDYRKIEELTNKAILEYLSE